MPRRRRSTPPSGPSATSAANPRRTNSSLSSRRISPKIAIGSVINDRCMRRQRESRHVYARANAPRPAGSADSGDHDDPDGEVGRRRHALVDHRRGGTACGAATAAPFAPGAGRQTFALPVSVATSERLVSEGERHWSRGPGRGALRFERPAPDRAGRAPGNTGTWEWVRRHGGLPVDPCRRLAASRSARSRPIARGESLLAGAYLLAIGTPYSIGPRDGPIPWTSPVADSIAP